MAAIISTYRHDYVAPKTARYSFIKKVRFSTDACKENCPCVEDIPKPKLSALGKTCEPTKWTGNAPAGKLLEPRVVPEKPLVPKPDKVNSCWLDQPNRFLKTISNTYPDLYDRLKNMPQDELRRSIENSRFKTTYQVDYCHLDEHPTGSYDQSKEQADEEQYRMSKLNEPCELFNQNNAFQMKGPGGGGGDGTFRGRGYGPEMTEKETKLCKPVKVNFAEEKSREASSHWDVGQFTKQLPLSEYMDTLGRTAFIILENNLHDHAICRKRNNCSHPIKSRTPVGLKALVNSQT